MALVPKSHKDLRDRIYEDLSQNLRQVDTTIATGYDLRKCLACGERATQEMLGATHLIKGSEEKYCEEDILCKQCASQPSKICLTCNTSVVPPFGARKFPVRRVEEQGGYDELRKLGEHTYFQDFCSVMLIRSQG